MLPMMHLTETTSGVSFHLKTVMTTGWRIPRPKWANGECKMHGWLVKALFRSQPCAFDNLHCVNGPLQWQHCIPEQGPECFLSICVKGSWPSLQAGWMFVAARVQVAVEQSCNKPLGAMLLKHEFYCCCAVMQGSVPYQCAEFFPSKVYTTRKKQP